MSRGALRVEPVDGVLVKELDGEAVLLDLQSETYFGLNATALRMWRELTSSPTIADALRNLAGHYDADAAAVEQDVLELLDELESRGLVRVGHA